MLKLGAVATTNAGAVDWSRPSVLWLGVAAVINVGVAKKKKERTHLMSIDTLDRETDRLHRREELGVLVVIATSSSLTVAEAGVGTSSSSLTAGGGGLGGKRVIFIAGVVLVGRHRR